MMDVPALPVGAALTLAAAIAAGAVQAMTFAPQEAAGRGRSVSPSPPRQYTYKVVRSFPHDPDAFTQGLVYADGVLYEGTGMHGRSGIRKVRLETGEVLQSRALGEQYFGEGIAVVGDRILQLTWQHELGFVYDRDTFAPRGTFRYTGEGWGLAYDGKRILMSSGSASGTLTILDPQSLRPTGRLRVHDGGRPVANLNELEFVKGEIFANVWQTERIARISPATGQVTGWIDLAGLLSARDAQGVDVMNGIAYDAARDRLFVTGKLWPRLFEIQVVPR